MGFIFGGGPSLRGGEGLIGRVKLGDFFRCLVGDLFDIHPALRRADEDHLLDATVECHAQIGFLVDVGGLLNPHLLDDVAPDRHAKNLLGEIRCLLRVPREFDAPCLAPSPRVDLRLDSAATLQCLSN